MPRTKGKPKLSSDQRVAIMLEKSMHRQTHQKIANKYDVSRRTVAGLKEDDLSPTERMTLEEKKQQMVVLASDVVVDGLQRMHTSIKTENHSLREVAGAVKIAHDIMQIQTSQPTEITQAQSGYEPLEFLRFLMSEYKVAHDRAVAMTVFAYPHADQNRLLTEGKQSA